MYSDSVFSALALPAPAAVGIGGVCAVDVVSAVLATRAAAALVAIAAAAVTEFVIMRIVALEAIGAVHNVPALVAGQAGVVGSLAAHSAAVIAQAAFFAEVYVVPLVVCADDRSLFNQLAAIRAVGIAGVAFSLASGGLSESDLPVRRVRVRTFECKFNVAHVDTARRHFVFVKVRAFDGVFFGQPVIHGNFTLD